jgi:hypothetical protein
MRTLALAVSLLGVVLVGGPAGAEIGTMDAVPAATLLVPYFEVDLANPGGVTTLFAINNASATAVLAHVTLWTDQAIPTLTFDVYLTGYDVQTINVRDLFNGVVPRTASVGQDPTDTISNQGLLSQDINFASCNSILPPGPLAAAVVTHLRNAHTGQASASFGGLCSGSNFGDNVARGYITVDTVTQCNALRPSDAGYFAGVASFQNVLYGDYFYVDSGNNFAQGDTAVHIEACIPGNGYIGYVGSGAGHCPLGVADYSFYRRYTGGDDQREGLATTFATRFLNGGAFSGGTDVIVWRDTKRVPTGPAGPYACGGLGPPAWFPLGQADVVAFDEQENATDLCAATACFPRAAARVPTNVAPLIVPVPFGWLYLNLNTVVAGSTVPFEPLSQAWVSPVMDAQGRFSVGFKGTALDNVTNPGVPPQILLP